MDFGLNLWNSPQKKKNGKLHPKWIQENAGDAWKNLNHGGKDWESFPTLPVCISFWNSYKFWNNIPQNNNRKKKKIKTNLANPPQRKKKKKFPQSFALESLGNVGKAQNSRDEKEPKLGFFFVSQGFGNYQRFQSLFQAESKKKNQKVGILPQQFPLPSQVLGGSRSLRKKKRKKEESNQTKVNRNGEFLHFFSSRNFREFRDLLPEFPAGRGAGKRSSHELGSLNAGWGWNSSVHAPKFRNSGAFPAKSSVSVAKAERGGVAESFYF